MSHFELRAIDHIGIRVSDVSRSAAFYGQLGFTTMSVDQDGDWELTNEAGIRINLIANAVPGEGHNILLDEPVKHAGYTHAAFVIDDVASALETFSAAGVDITEGPKDAPRRRYFFIRDPDGNVLEFNELKSGS